jgi:hypothetical protein
MFLSNKQTHELPPQKNVSGYLFLRRNLECNPKVTKKVTSVECHLDDFDVKNLDMSRAEVLVPRWSLRYWSYYLVKD